LARKDLEKGEGERNGGDFLRGIHCQSPPNRKRWKKGERGGKKIKQKDPLLVQDSGILLD